MFWQKKWHFQAKRSRKHFRITSDQKTEKVEQVIFSLFPSVF